MKINTIKIQNFRKLKSCKIEFSEKETIFVGANNSGKTTAMDALIAFLKTKKFRTQDFTLSNWTKLNNISEKWIDANVKDQDKSIKLIENLLPALDIWLNVESNELHYVTHLIPTLDWKGGSLGIRLRYEPIDIDELIKDFSSTFNKTNCLIRENNVKFKLWPKHFWDFCERKLNTYFTLRTYLLDPNEINTIQNLSDNNIPLEGDALKGLIKIDIINAQRGFSDVNSEHTDIHNHRNLSSQLRTYYDKHLNPSLDPTNADLEALASMNTAQKAFDENLKESFKTSLSELEDLNYPGFGNPKIELSSKVSTTDGLQHESAVQYLLNEGLSLPEKYNGLGYQNLISIIFKLIRFRDEWMRVGKNTTIDEDIIEPLQLVLIEEPEAHLHAQVQQVFIKKAYDVLRKNNYLKDNKDFTTQLVISTHSSYIAHQKFSSLRYFKRNVSNELPTSEVINLSTTFGNENNTAKFVIRYLNTTHNDIFFADGVILVEGPAERILVPHFIKNGCKALDNCYITILEIGGSHAHTLKPLIETLGITCLIITDIDSKNLNNQKCKPAIDQELVTDNDTLKTWHPRESKLDKLLSLSYEEKKTKQFPIRVAYQKAVFFKTKDKKISVYPYTFEDSLVLENREVFKKIKKSKGLLKKMVNAAKIVDVQESAQKAYDEINSKNAKKAEFALDVLFMQDPKDLVIPNYIVEGLKWLEEQLNGQKLNI